MIDFHSHILFDMDDGATSVSESADILALMSQQGFETVALTPHFECALDVEHFLSHRNRAAEELKAELMVRGIDIDLRLGAEVYVNREVHFACDIEKLAIEGTNVLLSEFQYRNLAPETLFEYIRKLQSFGVRVLMAHPERYEYLRGNKFLVQHIADMGVLFQINASAYDSDNSKERAAARFFVSEGYATLMGSDVHCFGGTRTDFRLHLADMDARDAEFLTNTNPKSIIDNA